MAAALSCTAFSRAICALLLSPSNKSNCNSAPAIQLLPPFHPGEGLSVSHEPKTFSRGASAPLAIDMLLDWALRSDSTVYYAGAASGGVWKSNDSGKTFAPVFDGQPVQAIGALAVARSNHNIVWAGTGEAWAIRDSDMMGDGVYKSTDAGATWTNMGLRETGRIGRIVVNPVNPDIVFVCAAGRLTGPQQERGVFRTLDGGKTWDRSLFVDADTGCSGLSMDASDPKTLVAGAWRVVMHTYAMFRD